MMSEIEQLWSEHCRAAFPDEYRGAQIASVELVLLDADIVGCVETFLKRPESLNERQLAVLGLSLRDAARVQQELRGSAQAYVARLERLAALVLEHVARSQSQA
jgi:hypothetical protein